MKDLTLFDALQWVAFRAFNVPYAEHIQNKDKLEQAKRHLSDAFASGRIRVTCDNIPIAFERSYTCDWADNRIFPVYPGQYFLDDIAKNNIQVCYTDLMREFPPGNNKPVKRPQAKPDRPERRIVHDIAFYFWKTNQQLNAKELYLRLEETLQTYPELKEKIAKSGTVQKWFSEFRKGAYQPATDKAKLSAQFPRLFSKLNNRVG